ncbi:MAG: DMT family transporter [Gemmatimonadaceae bacterium]|nr:DMT family transporter [Gemmatimonadaceae bacterium]
MTDPSSRSPVAPLVLCVAVLAISTAAPLVRLADAAPLVIVTWRLGLSVAVVGALAMAGGTWRQWRRLSRGDLLLALGAGVSLAVHFWSWTASIGLTSVAASVVLVNLQPVIVAAGSAWWLHERPSRRQWAGVMVAVVGAGIVGLGDGALARPSAPGRHPALGNALAVVGAVTAAAYYLAGRRLRASLDLWPYTTLVYGTCFVVLLGAALVTGASLWPVTPREVGLYAALALGPMLLGHTGMNWALRHLPAFVVNLTVLGEPVGATLLAWAIPAIGESPSPTVLLGGALVLAGAVRAARR